MKRKIILVVAVVIELIFLKQWLSCMRYPGQFHFSQFDLSLRLIEAIHNDGGVPLFIVRLFHNKIVGTVIDVYNSYTHYWDITFLVSLLSFVGVFGLLSCVWYLFRGKLKGWAGILFAVALVFPIVEILVTYNFPFILQLGLIAIPLAIMSSVGWWHFLAGENRLRYGLFIVLEILSILWLLSVLLQSNLIFCLR
jgi:hypothetical protein